MDSDNNFKTKFTAGKLLCQASFCFCVRFSHHLLSLLCVPADIHMRWYLNFQPPRGFDLICSILFQAHVCSAIFMVETDYTIVSKVLSLICELNKIKQTWNSLHYASLLESLVVQPPGHIGCQMFKVTSART